MISKAKYFFSKSLYIFLDYSSVILKGDLFTSLHGKSLAEKSICSYVDAVYWLYVVKIMVLG